MGLSLTEKLLDKSQEAFCLAIEMYNKPTIKYRVEAFALFMCNAWELMLKAHIINTMGAEKIYYKNNPGRTNIDLMPSMVDFAKETSKMGIGVLAVTTTPKAYEKEKPTLAEFNNIKVGLGLHPQLVSERYSEISLIERFIDCEDYIGEIGLDFNNRFYASKEKQLVVFENIIQWCSQLSGKVISIHTVRSDKIALDTIEKFSCADNNICILHWFSGTQTQQQRAIEMGCYFSVNYSMLASPNGKKLISTIPKERILIESDAPFVNEIQSVQQLARELASIKSSLAESYGNDVLESIRRNSKYILFGKTE